MPTITPETKRLADVIIKNGYYHPATTLGIYGWNYVYCNIKGKFKKYIIVVDMPLPDKYLEFEKFNQPDWKDSIMAIDDKTAYEYFKNKYVEDFFECCGIAEEITTIRMIEKF